MSDMETITQTSSIVKNQSSTSHSKSSFDDSFFSNDIILGYSPSMYNSSNNKSAVNATSTTSKQDKMFLELMGYETIDPIDSYHSNVKSMFAVDASKSSSNESSKKPTSSSYKTNKKTITNNDTQDSAQKKFGSAKGFGSDQFFDKQSSPSEISSNLSRFEGSSSISSADYFGDGSGRGASSPRGNFFFFPKAPV